MLHALSEDRWFDIDLISEDVRFPLLFDVVKLANAIVEFNSSLAVAPLKGVRFAIFSVGVFFVTMFDEDDFAELAKGCYRTAAATFPQSLVAFANRGSQLLA